MLTKLEKVAVITQLLQLGLTNRESALYIQSLQAGPSTVQELASQLEENRVTIHSAAQQLLKKGLLFETRKGKKRFIVAEDPEIL